MSSLPPDPYKILGVAKDAQITEIRSAHRKLVLKCHPDKIQDTELKAQKADEFQKVQQAYELLSDDNERAKYDDQVKLAELRRQMQSKANTSSPRTSPKYTEFEIRTAEPRSTTFKTTTTQMPPRSKTYHTYSRSYEEELGGRGPRIFETEIRTSSRREATFSGEKPSKREREREKDKSDRERRKEDVRIAEKQAEKAAKEARRVEKKKAEKLRDKEIKAATEDKKRQARPYMEAYEEEIPSPRTEKKKSSGGSSKKQEEKRERDRERSIPRGEVPPSMPSQSRSFTEDKTVDAAQYAASYIEAARGKHRSGSGRTAAYHTARSVQPPVPTPPPAQTTVFPTPEDEEEVRRSSARSRRGSGETSRPLRERSYRKASRDGEDAAYIINASPSPRRATQYDAPLSTSPQSMHPHGPMRTNTMPADGYSRSIPIPPPTRSRTFSAYGQSDHPRGRDRSRLHPQFEEESDDEDYERERRRSERKHRSKKNRSPDGRETLEHRYRVNNERHPVYTATYARNGAEAEVNGSRYYSSGSTGYVTRDASYASRSGGAKFDKFKQSKDYDYGDVTYSEYPQQYQRDSPAAYA